jgi:hypothetical protein
MVDSRTGAGKNRTISKNLIVPVKKEIPTIKM